MLWPDAIRLALAPAFFLRDIKQYFIHKNLLKTMAYEDFDALHATGQVRRTVPSLSIATIPSWQGHCMVAPPTPYRTLHCRHVGHRPCREA
jgi:hypothetical protein